MCIYIDFARLVLDTVCENLPHTTAALANLVKYAAPKAEKVLRNEKSITNID